MLVGMSNGTGKGILAKKLKMELPKDPAVLLWGIYTKESRVSTGYLYTHAHTNVVRDIPKVEVPQGSITYG